MGIMKKVLKSNKGLSLLELIVAVCFLAIVITPVMNSFITAGKINAKSRKLMCANDCAQAIMEGIADKTFYELSVAFTSEYGSSDVSANRALTGLNDGAYNKKTCSTNTIDTNTVYSGGFTLTTGSLSAFTNYSVDYKPPLTPSAAVATYITNDSISNNSSFAYIINEGFRRDCKTKLLDLNTDLEKHLCVWTNDSNPDDIKYLMLCYSGIEWDGYYFDAVVTFIPEGREPAIGASEDVWFSYYVQIDLYELKKTGSGFVRTLGIDETGADTVSPLLSLNTGIKNN